MLLLKISVVDINFRVMRQAPLLKINNQLDQKMVIILKLNSYVLIYETYVLVGRFTLPKYLIFWNRSSK